MQKMFAKTVKAIRSSKKQWVSILTSNANIYLKDANKSQRSYKNRFKGFIKKFRASKVDEDAPESIMKVLRAIKTENSKKNRSILIMSSKQKLKYNHKFLINFDL